MEVGEGQSQGKFFNFFWAEGGVGQKGKFLLPFGDAPKIGYFFNSTVYTNVITFGGITYTLDPTYNTGETNPYWKRVHSVQFEMELFGCDNYQIDEGETLKY